jgi:hypothetical protein
VSRPTTVVNIRTGDPYDVYVGRGGPYGNPFVIGKNGTREEVINKYKALVKSDPAVRALLRKCKGKRLGCYCHPLPCHGDIIADLCDGRRL